MLLNSGANASIMPLKRGSYRFTPHLIALMTLVDTFGGALQNVLPASLLLRAGLVILLLVHLLYAKARQPKMLILWCVILGYFALRLFVDFFLLLDQRVVSMEAGSTMKLLYFPLLYTYFSDGIESGDVTAEQMRRGVLWYGWLVIISLVLGKVTGLGSAIGGRGTDIEGGKGFMIGANEVGVMLVLTAPFVLADLLSRLRSVLLASVLELVIYAAAGVYVFTKSSLISTVVAGYSVFRALMQGGRFTRNLVWAGGTMATIFMARSIIINWSAIEQFAQTTFFAALLDEGIIAFLFRGRDTYISAIFPQMLDHPLNFVFYLFGAGEFYFRQLSTAPLMLPADQATSFEMDFFDLFAAYGLIGTFFYCLIVGLVVKMSQLRRPPAEVILAVVCAVVHAFMAGHVLYSPQVTTILVLVLLAHAQPGSRPK